MPCLLSVSGTHICLDGTYHDGLRRPCHSVLANLDRKLVERASPWYWREPASKYSLNAALMFVPLTIWSSQPGIDA